MKWQITVTRLLQVKLIQTDRPSVVSLNLLVYQDNKSQKHLILGRETFPVAVEILSPSLGLGLLRNLSRFNWPRSSPLYWPSSLYLSLKAGSVGVAAPPLVWRWTHISSFWSWEMFLFYFSAAIYMCNVLHRDMLNARLCCPFCQLCLLKCQKVKKKYWFYSQFWRRGSRNALLFGQQDANESSYFNLSFTQQKAHILFSCLFKGPISCYFLCSPSSDHFSAQTAFTMMYLLLTLGAPVLNLILAP